jgi:GNAT superfamily N-acetyltransferase
VKSLVWDTEFFGIAIGQSDLSDGALDEEMAEARSSDIACLYLTMPADRLDLAGDCIRAGACVVDVRTVLDRSPNAGPSLATPDVRFARPEDFPALAAYSADLSRESRFRADPRFPDAGIRGMYRLWIERCHAEGFVLVLSDGPSGFVGARIDGDALSIDLVYMAPEARGRGLAGQLVRAALQHAPGRRGVVATQAGNVGAQRLYQGLGFKTRSVQLVRSHGHRSRRAAGLSPG